VTVPARVRRQAGRYALVDGIPFRLPITCEKSPALMAGFSIDADKARDLLPQQEIFPLRLWNGRGVLLITVINYRITTIGQYIEFSIGIACTHGARPAPRLVPAALTTLFGTGQFVVDLPVSTEISVKGGKGIWGMPKHRAALDFLISDRTVSSMYALEGQEAVTIEIDRPSSTRVPFRASALNYCAFRGMLMKSSIHFSGRAGISLFRRGAARLRLGPHPRVAPLKTLDVSPDPMFTAFIPEASGTLDDHVESWFLTYDAPPARAPEGLESVIGLGLGQEWLPPPRAAVAGATELVRS
jgi:hypothetical protein